MKIVTSVGLFNDAVGTRMSITCSEIDENTGTIRADNKRLDRIVTDTAMLKKIAEIRDFAQGFVDAEE